ncbi:MAG: Mu transposase C-terminal domain-containing protein [Opitutaceae bacterium]|nr:Mu transposase C-terminal domain-containing protein [Opitutaceae bacterium]
MNLTSSSLSLPTGRFQPRNSVGQRPYLAPSVAVFTVGQIAKASGENPRTIRDHMATADASQAQTTLQRGQVAQGWPVAALPAKLKDRLADLADEHCYGRTDADIERFLSRHSDSADGGRSANQRWKPRVPVARLPQSQIDQARRRCAALAPVLRAHLGQPISDLVAAARPAWRAASGYTVSDRTLHRWIRRALDRDLGFNEWERWEIWLDTDVTTVAPTADTTAAQILETPRLEEKIADVVQPAALTKDEREQIWAAAMNDASVMVRAGHGEALAQRTVLRVLSMSGLAMAKNPNALRTTYRRKRAAWLAGGELLTAIADKRKAAARARKLELPQCDRDLLVQLARTHGHSLPRAYRAAHRGCMLSAVTMARYPILPRDKSFVPHAIQEAVLPWLIPIAINGRGPRARRLNGPSTDCDWSTVEPGDVYEFDDLTLPLLWWKEDPNDPRGFYFGQGQLLAAVDSKTGFILSWILIARSGYTSRDILLLVREINDTYGLPRKYLLFECGIWKKARIINGSPSERDKGQICDGLASAWPVQHTSTPKGKAIIERTFGLIQARQEHIPGYCGRDMRKDCPQVTKQAMDAVKAGRVHPSKYFLHAEQVMALLEDIAASIHNEPLGIRTKRIPGQTPQQAWDARDTTSMQYFGPEHDHLFKTHRLEQKITIDGIRLPNSLEGALYRNAVTGQLIGQRVLCWVDPLDLSSIFITDLDGHNPQLVERAERPAARGADGPSLSRNRQQSAEHMRCLDVLTRVTKPQLSPADFRPVVTDGVSRHLGAQMAEQKQAHKSRQRESLTMQRQLQRLSERHGVDFAVPEDPQRLRDKLATLNADDAHWQDVDRRAKEKIDL